VSKPSWKFQKDWEEKIRAIVRDEVSKLEFEVKVRPRP